MIGSYAGSYRRGNNASDGWSPTPMWHPKRWVGLSWRRWEWNIDTIGAAYDGEWHYQTTVERAKDGLDQQFNDDRNGSYNSAEAKLREIAKLRKIVKNGPKR